MPTVQDYDESEDEQGAGGSAHRVAMGGGGAQLKQATPQQQSSFVPWERFVSANKDVASREANSLNSEVGGEVSGVKGQTQDAQTAFNKGIEGQYEHQQPAKPQSGAIAAPHPASQASTFGNSASQGAFGRFAQQNAAPASTPRGPLTRQEGPMVPPTQLKPDISEQRTGVTANALNNGPQGPKDLEGMLGQDAWGKLLGGAVKGQADAQALGSETGVQGLIQQRAQAPLAQGGAFDAALEYGQGQKAFGQTAKSGADLVGGVAGANEGAQGSWNRLLGDIGEARRQRDATAEADAFNAAQARGGQQGSTYDPEANAKATQDAWDALNAGGGLSAYTFFGGPGGVNGVGSKDSFFDALKWGGGYPAGQQNVQGAMTADQIVNSVASGLGLNQQQVEEMFQKMSDEDWQKFWLLGVIPVGTPGVDPSKTGVPGAWNSPYAQGAGKYHDGGGMMNALDNFNETTGKTMGEVALAALGI